VVPGKRRCLSPPYYLSCVKGLDMGCGVWHSGGMVSDVREAGMYRVTFRYPGESTESSIVVYAADADGARSFVADHGVEVSRVESV
jgi:hypothetical protein